MRLDLQVPVRLREPVIEVDPGLEPGVYTIELVVVSSTGSRSLPTRLKLEVTRGIIRSPVPPPPPPSPP